MKFRKILSLLVTAVIFITGINVFAADTNKIWVADDVWISGDVNIDISRTEITVTNTMTSNDPYYLESMFSNAKLLIAGYSKNIYVGCESKNYKFQPEYSFSLSQVTGFSLNGVDTIKAFLWDMTDGYTPLCESVAATGRFGVSDDLSNIPKFIQTAAISVANTVNLHQSNDSITFAFLSDAHIGWYADTENKAVTQAAQALKVINNYTPIDFMVHGGDISTGGASTTKENTFYEMSVYSGIMNEYTSHIPSIWCIGNHDDAPYRATDERLTQKETYQLFGSKNLLAGASCNDGCNYGYVDFDNKKIRVIYLDTHDKRDWGSIDSTYSTPDFLSVDNISKTQLDWLANTALDFTDKNSPDEWGVIVVSHAELNASHSYTDPSVPYTYYAYNTSNAARVLRAYEDGTKITVSNLQSLKNSYQTTYDFSSVKNRAQVYCLVHGHNHAYLLNDVQGFNSIGCPNMMNGRERISSNGVIYTKIPNTAKGTSFCIITVDRKNKTIYADHYGAGFDRIIRLDN